MIAHSCSSWSAQPLHPIKSICLRSLSRGGLILFWGNDVRSDLDQTSLYLCVPHSRCTPKGTLAQPAPQLQRTMMVPEHVSETAERAWWKWHIEKSGAKEQQSECLRKRRRKFESVAVQMHGAGVLGGEGKWMKTEALLMFVGGILMHSGGDSTPSSRFLFLAVHLWVSAYKPWLVMARVGGLGFKPRSRYQAQKPRKGAKEEETEVLVSVFVFETKFFFFNSEAAVKLHVK